MRTVGLVMIKEPDNKKFDSIWAHVIMAEAYAIREAQRVSAEIAAKHRPKHIKTISDRDDDRLYVAVQTSCIETPTKHWAWTTVVSWEVTAVEQRTDVISALAEVGSRGTQG
jgi:hypothetical protein